MIVVNANVPVDILDDDRHWTEWSVGAIVAGSLSRTLVTGPVLLAELARYADDAKTLEAIPTGMGITCKPWSVDASLMAGRAFAAYRSTGGRRRAILAIFLSAVMPHRSAPQY